MKAILQNFKNGQMTIEDLPTPSLRPEGIIVQNICSLVSSGTEKAVIDFAKMNPVRKSLARPDLFKKVLNKVKQDGIISTGKVVNNLISAPLPLGYSSSGIAIEIGSKVSDISPGQKVACAGLGYANHAEFIYVPRNLLVPVPMDVDFEEAAFVTLGSIAMQGFRQANLTLGETVVIIGMGLVGQITSQICLASGCNVIIADIDQSKVQLGTKLGSVMSIHIRGKNIISEVIRYTNGNLADAVIIAAGTKSNDPLEIAPDLLRDRGRVVAVGDVGHDLPRRAYYEKEIILKQSRSYGPGRYDTNYEEKGIDYPIGYVRWTENRNMSSFIELIKSKKVKLNKLITHNFKIEDALKAYKLLSAKNSKPVLGIIINYNKTKVKLKKILKISNRPITSFEGNKKIVLGVIGAGQFAQGVLLPIFKKENLFFKTIATSSGLTSVNVGKKYGAEFCTSNYEEIINDKFINTILIATRHNTHAKILISALKKNKNCFVEKPLATSDKELNEIIKTYKKSSSIVMVGFNRRFSPLSTLLKEEFKGSKLIFNYRINAGYIDKKEWQQDNEIGGGRIVGEICHFVDLLSFLCGSFVKSVSANFMLSANSNSDPDNLSITLSFSDGSLGTIIYTSVGDPSFSKERLEVFGNNQVGVIENWRSLKIQGNGKKISKNSLIETKKGFDEEISKFIEGCESGKSPISFESLVNTTKTTFIIQKALRSGLKENII